VKPPPNPLPKSPQKLIVAALVALFLAFPFLGLLAHGTAWKLPPLDELSDVLLFTTAQALASALVSLVLGLVGAFGIHWLAEKAGAHFSRFIQGLILLPNAAPVIVLLLAVMKFFPFARGFFGIVFVHTLLNMGLVSVVALSLFQSRVSTLAELAWIEGATGVRFFLKGVLPLIWSDLGVIFLFVFALCFTSFAVPLMIGGSHATTLEVLIYQKVRLDLDWSQALGLAGVQVLAVLWFAWFLGAEKSRRSTSMISARRLEHPTPLLSWKWGLLIAVIPPFIVALGLMSGFVSGVARLLSMNAVIEVLPQLLLGSLGVAVGTGLLSVSLLLLLAYLNPRGWFRNFLIGYATPSAALTGFALLIVWRDLGLATYFKIILGITLATVPAFYRLRWDALLSGLQNQRTVGESLGASDGLIFRRIVLPQIARSAFFIGGLAALWAWGDFALSSVVAERSVTIALLVGSLMEAYRFDAATVLVWILLLGGLSTFFIFQGVGRVLGAKPEA
jgi:thiamine transport system permease protein